MITYGSQKTLKNKTICSLLILYWNQELNNKIRLDLFCHLPIEIPICSIKTNCGYDQETPQSQITNHYCKTHNIGGIKIWRFSKTDLLASFNFHIGSLFSIHVGATLKGKNMGSIFFPLIVASFKTWLLYFTVSYFGDFYFLFSAK